MALVPYIKPEGVSIADAISNLSSHLAAAGAKATAITADDRAEDRIIVRTKDAAGVKKAIGSFTAG